MFWCKNILGSIFSGGLSEVENFLVFKTMMKICGKELLWCVVPTQCYELYD